MERRDAGHFRHCTNRRQARARESNTTGGERSSEAQGELPCASNAPPPTQGGGDCARVAGVSFATLAYGKQYDASAGGLGPESRASV